MPYTSMTTWWNMWHHQPHWEICDRHFSQTALWNIWYTYSLTTLWNVWHTGRWPHCEKCDGHFSQTALWNIGYTYSLTTLWNVWHTGHWPHCEKCDCPTAGADVFEFDNDYNDCDSCMCWFVFREWLKWFDNVQAVVFMHKCVCVCVCARMHMCLLEHVRMFMSLLVRVVCSRHQNLLKSWDMIKEYT